MLPSIFRYEQTVWKCLWKNCKLFQPPWLPLEAQVSEEHPIQGSFHDDSGRNVLPGMNQWGDIVISNPVAPAGRRPCVMLEQGCQAKSWTNDRALDVIETYRNQPHWTDGFLSVVIMPFSVCVKRDSIGFILLVLGCLGVLFQCPEMPAGYSYPRPYRPCSFACDAGKESSHRAARSPDDFSWKSLWQQGLGDVGYGWMVLDLLGANLLFRGFAAITWSLFTLQHSLDKVHHSESQ